MLHLKQTMAQHTHNGGVVGIPGLPGAPGGAGAPHPIPGAPGAGAGGPLPDPFGKGELIMFYVDTKF